MKSAVLTFVSMLACSGILNAMAERTLPPVLGGAILLDNDQLIEGEIRREGERVIIRRGASETALPATRVVEIVADRKAAVRVMRERSNRRDPDERQRLIRWCMENGLRDDALQEAEELLKFRPNDTRLRDLVAGLRQIAPARQATPPNPPMAISTQVLEVEPQEFNPESFGTFVSKVQPILMNVCYSCHGAGKGGGYTLIRADDGFNRKASIHNLTATLRHLDRHNPLESSFLVKSITAHGNAARPPLRDRLHPAYGNLEVWVAVAVAPDATEPLSIKPIGVTKPLPKIAEPVVRFGESSKSKPSDPVPTEAKDPFDPAIFNGTIQRKK